MNFKPGQELVCIHKGQWIGTCGDIGIGPEFNETVTVESGCWAYPGNIFLAEYPLSTTGRQQSFKSIWFQPLVSDKVLEEELESLVFVN